MNAHAEQYPRVRTPTFRVPPDCGSKILLGVMGAEGESILDTVGLDAGCSDILETLPSVSEELARYRSVPEVTEAVLDLALSIK